MSRVSAKQELVSIFVHDGMRQTRFWLAFGAFVWAVLLLWPGSLFPTAEQLAHGCSAATGCRQTYALMARIAPENVWGVLFLVQSLAAFYALLTCRTSRWLLFADAFLGCILWTASTVACFTAHFHSFSTYQPPAAMSAEVMAACASWWHLIRFWASNNDAER